MLTDASTLIRDKQEHEPNVELRTNERVDDEIFDENGRLAALARRFFGCLVLSLVFSAVRPQVL